MMSFFKTKFTSERLVQTSGKSAYASNISGWCMIKPMDAFTTQTNGIQAGEGFKIFVDIHNDVNTADKITIDDDKYEVRGVTKTLMGSLQVKVCTVIQKKL